LGSIDAVRIQKPTQVRAAQRKMGYSPVTAPSLQGCHSASVTSQAWQHICDTTSIAAELKNVKTRIISAQLELHGALNCIEPENNLMSLCSPVSMWAALVWNQILYFSTSRNLIPGHFHVTG